MVFAHDARLTKMKTLRSTLQLNEIAQSKKPPEDPCLSICEHSCYSNVLYQHNYNVVL